MRWAVRVAPSASTGSSASGSRARVCSRAASAVVICRRGAPPAAVRACQPGTHARKAGTADGHHEGERAAAEQQQRGERLLAGVVGQRRHGQLV